MSNALLNNAIPAYVAQIIKCAVNLCQQRGVRLTPLRRQVLELVLHYRKPVGAYTLLEDLHDEQGRRAAPPTVYRALNFLLEQGLIHRITSLNAFTACAYLSHPHVGQFLICECCGDATEFDAPNINKDIMQHAQQLGFKVEKQTIEISGQCAHCQQLTQETHPRNPTNPHDPDVNA